MPPDRGQAGPPDSRKGDDGVHREVIFEFTPIGGSVKVTATDVTTGIEVSVVGPSAAARSELERVALQKLRYILEKQDETKKEGTKDEPETPGGRGGGIIV